MTNSDLANKWIKDDGWLGWLAQAGRWDIYLVSVVEILRKSGAILSHWIKKKRKEKG